MAEWKIRRAGSSSDVRVAGGRAGGRSRRSPWPLRGDRRPPGGGWTARPNDALTGSFSAGPPQSPDPIVLSPARMRPALRVAFAALFGACLVGGSGPARANAPAPALTASFPQSGYVSDRHLGPGSLPQIVIEFSEEVSPFDTSTPSIRIEGGTLRYIEPYPEAGFPNRRILKIRPAGIHGDVTFRLVARQACGAGGICTPGGAMLGTVPGPKPIPGLTEDASLREFVQERVFDEYGSEHPWLAEMEQAMARDGIFVISQETPGGTHHSRCDLQDDATGLSICRSPFFILGPGTDRSGAPIPGDAVHELAHAYTLGTRIPSSPRAVTAAHLYLSQTPEGQRGGSRCASYELLADLATLDVMGDAHVPGYWRWCHGTYSDAETRYARELVRTALGGRVPAWFGGRYPQAETSSAVRRSLWNDIIALIGGQRQLAAWAFREDYGGYCDTGLVNAQISRHNSYSADPWRAGGCVPGAPEIESAVVDAEGRLSVVIEPPESTGAAPIRSYVLEWRTEDQQFDASRRAVHAGATPPAEPWTIETRGTPGPVEVRVSARNVQGSGAWTNAGLTLPPAVSITAGTSPVAEGAEVAFTLSRTGSASAALTVMVTATESGTMIDGTVPTEVIFAAGSATAALALATSDDEVSEDASSVTATVAAGDGYTVAADAGSAVVTVEDDDATPVMTNSSPITSPENATAVATLEATDEDTAAERLMWALVGGADGGAFSLTPGGELAFKEAKDFEAPDDTDTDGDYQVVVRVSDGANAALAVLAVRLVDADEVAPVVSGVTVNGGSLVLSFSEALNESSAPATDAFAVTVEGNAREVTVVAVAGSTVTLTLAMAVALNETVTVSYRVPAGADAARIEDAAGNVATDFSEVVVPLTARFEDVPARHDGTQAITFELHFSEEFRISYQAVRDAVMEVTGGTVRMAMRLVPGSNMGWRITLEPSTDGDVTVGVPADRACSETGAVCTNDGRRLSNRLELIVPGPASINAAPTGLPTISGTARAGETLTASVEGIADGDGLANATFAYQWISNSGTEDADIEGAIEATYTLAVGDEGKTIKVRVTFTDDRNTEETLLSAATAVVTASPIEVSIAAATSPVTEGSNAVFTLRRTGDTAAPLTVGVRVTEAGAVLSGSAPAQVTFPAGSSRTRLTIATLDDDAAEGDARVTASVAPGDAYGVATGGGAAGIHVLDNDRGVASQTVLWSADIMVLALPTGFIGAGSSHLFSNIRGSDSHAVRWLWYSARTPRLYLGFAQSQPGREHSTLHLGDVALEIEGEGASQSWDDIDLDWSDRETLAVRITRRTEADQPAARVGVSVADAQVREVAGALLAFRVTLDEARETAVSVRYATADGTARAGTDYVPASGAVRFAPGVTERTVEVEVLEDAHDEGAETLTLTLSAPFGAELGDSRATGTIINTDPLPKAWLARFGRTVADHSADAIGERLTGPAGEGSHVTLGGRRLLLRGGSVPQGADGGVGERRMAGGRFGDIWRREGAGVGRRTMTERELLLGSSFHLEFGDGEDGPGDTDTRLTAWGRAAASRFGGETEGLALDGNVTTFAIGADAAIARWLAGVAVALSEGEGSFRDWPETGRESRGTGELESTLTSLHPYVRYEASERLSLWGILGYGVGALELEVDDGERWTTDTTLEMAAVGARGVLVRAEETSGFELAARTDARGARMRSEAAKGSAGGNLAATKTETSRLRLVLEGSRRIEAGDRGTLTPNFEVGLRHDGGDAETGTGVEIGGGLRYHVPMTGLSAEVMARRLVVHEDGEHTERGVSGMIHLEPDAAGRGLSLSVVPSWGAGVASGAERWWSLLDVPGRAANDAFEPGSRLDVEIGYGFEVPGGRGVATPHAGWSRSSASETLRLGQRLRLGTSEWRLEGEFAEEDRTLRAGWVYRPGRWLNLGLEASRHEPANDGPALELMLRAGMRW